MPSLSFLNDGRFTPGAGHHSADCRRVKPAISRRRTQNRLTPEDEDDSVDLDNDSDSDRPVKRRRHRCDECGKSFATKQTLKVAPSSSQRG
uniref:C2H2-type domain-containing protein n=1 Tax=Macrostomum lignano TaxID=282301 RepID=A0A1I8JPD7_9PLAT